MGGEPKGEEDKEKDVKVGDVIMTINDELVDSTWTQRDVVTMIRELNAPSMEDPLVMSFDRQYRQHAVQAIKGRVAKAHKKAGAGQ